MSVTEADVIFMSPAMRAEIVILSGGETRQDSSSETVSEALTNSLRYLLTYSRKILKKETSLPRANSDSP